MKMMFYVTDKRTLSPIMKVRRYLQASPGERSDQPRRRWGWGHGKPYRSVCCKKTSQAQSANVKMLVVVFHSFNGSETDPHEELSFSSTTPLHLEKFPFLVT